MIPTGWGPSPAAETARRTSEKAQIQDIKERFGNYIRNVKSMRNQIKQGEDTSTIQHLQEELITIRNLYEKEIGELREKLEQSYQEGNRDGLSGRQSNLMAADYQSRLLEMSRDILKKDEDIRALHLILATQESDIQSLKGSAIAPSVQLDLAKQELRELQGNILMAQNKYEEEFSQRLTLQDQLRELKHHTDDIRQIHMKETQELQAQVAQSQTLVLRLEDELRCISRGGPALVEAVQRIQEASEAEVKRLQSETESFYNQNLMELQMRMDNDQILLGQAQEDNKRLYRRVEELTSEVTALEKKLFEEGRNSRTLIEKLEAEHMKGLQHIRALEARLEELQDLLLAKMKELNTFQESNVSLRNELDAMKAMLEEEEHQMTIGNWHCPQTSSSSSNPLTDSFPSSVHNFIPEHYKTPEVLPLITTSYSNDTSSAPSTEESSLKGENTVEDVQDQIDQFKRSTSAPPRSSQMPKRSKRQDSFCSVTDNTNPKCINKIPPLTRNDRTNAVSSALGYLEISEVDPSGNFVRIVNQSLDKEEDIGGCLLQQNIQGHPVSIYRFPPKTRVMARCVVTIWASSAGVTHNPPTDFLWKEKSKFVTEQRCTTILCTSNGKAMAWFTPLKNKMRKSVKKNLLESEPISEVHASEQPKKDGEPITEEDTDSPPAHRRLEKVPTLLKRDKIPPAVLPMTSSPWTHSTSSPTHPDFTPSRFVPLGSDGNSQCRQTRLPTAKTEPTSGVPSAGSRHGRDPAISPVSKNSRGPTRSAGAVRGTLRLLIPGSFAPPSAQHQAGLQILQSVQNLGFQPPMPQPPAPTSW
ncbi:PREDICTED: lamin tail domain-containing protein 1 [Nanorana parkeri]|uniref:lamin tail domain-containing protein 1 n=1 Tax=Nanorana parkeri TaxID=125878 RepID=UPI0008548E4A|nr:PREDICTED: lamin tail domain-containing protein 1 [Nanorana parkeri]